MPITAPPAIPQITDPATFSVRAQDWVVWQAEQLYPEIIAQSALLGLSLSGTSVTSNTIGTGSKSFTVQTGKGFAAGQSIVIARTSASTNRMFCVVTSYNSGTGALVVTSQAFEGTGTFTDWTISPTLNAVLTAAQVPDGLITTNKIADDQVTFAKMQNIATSKLLGRASASSGDVEELGIGSGLSLSGSNLTALSIGVGQTWQNVTASRAAATTYTNSTGKPILVIIKSTPTTANTLFTFFVDSVEISAAQGSSANGCVLNTSVIVPNGSTYRVTVTIGSIGTWFELR